MGGYHPKLLSDIPEEVDILITMGCNVVCPYVPCRYREDWGLEDPSGGPIEDYRKTRNIIKEKVMDLIQRVKKQTNLMNIKEDVSGEKNPSTFSFKS